MAYAFDRCPGCFAEPWVEDRACPGCGYELDPEAFWTALRPGSDLADRYVVGRVLGRPGGFGVTYLAWDRVLERRVAMKELLPRMLVSRDRDRTTVRVQTEADTAQFRQTLAWFLDEARMIARFNHPNLVRVLDYFEQNGTAYFAMDFYEGRTLAEHLDAEGPRMAWRDALDVILPILDGLQVVHAEGVLHRDVKPTNLYLADAGRPILLDFGTARAALAGETATLTSFHSPGYTPPEQLAGRRQGPWTDVYGCAATLYEMLTGSTPVETTGPVPAEAQEPPKSVDPSIPDHVSDAVMRGLATRPEERPPSAAAFTALLKGEPVPTDDDVSAVWKERRLGGDGPDGGVGAEAWEERPAAAFGSVSATEVLGGSSDFEPGPVGGADPDARVAGGRRAAGPSSVASERGTGQQATVSKGRRWLTLAVLALIVLGAGSFAAASIWSGAGDGSDDGTEAAAAVAEAGETDEGAPDADAVDDAAEPDAGVDAPSVDPDRPTSAADAGDATTTSADAQEVDAADAADDAAPSTSPPAAGPPPTGVIVVVYGEEGRVAESLVTRRILERSDLTAVDPDGLAVVRRDAGAIVDAGDVAGLAELARRHGAEVLAIGRLTTDVGASAVSATRVTGSATLTFTLYRVSDGRTLGSEDFELPTGVQGTTPGDVRTEAARRVARMAADAAIRWLEGGG